MFTNRLVANADGDLAALVTAAQKQLFSGYYTQVTARIGSRLLIFCIIAILYYLAQQIA
jgi:hypothetical protein